MEAVHESYATTLIMHSFDEKKFENFTSANTFVCKGALQRRVCRFGCLTEQVDTFFHNEEFEGKKMDKKYLVLSE